MKILLITLLWQHLLITLEHYLRVKETLKNH